MEVRGKAKCLVNTENVYKGTQEEETEELTH